MSYQPIPSEFDIRLLSLELATELNQQNPESERTADDAIVVARAIYMFLSEEDPVIDSMDDIFAVPEEYAGQDDDLPDDVYDHMLRGNVVFINLQDFEEGQ